MHTSIASGSRRGRSADAPAKEGSEDTDYTEPAEEEEGNLQSPQEEIEPQVG